jgi:hypothetical protein
VKRKLKLETRYAYLLRDAKTMTVILELAASRLSDTARGKHSDVVIGRKIDGTEVTASDVREMASECARIAHECGRQHRRRR